MLRDAVEAIGRGPLAVRGLCASPIHGAKGNVEFFLLARRGDDALPVDVDAVVDRAWAGAATGTSEVVGRASEG